jgi:hypothetical protein
MKAQPVSNWLSVIGSVPNGIKSGAIDTGI